MAARGFRFGDHMRRLSRDKLQRFFDAADDRWMPWTKALHEVLEM
jgi:hypothetical protein